MERYIGKTRDGESIYHTDNWKGVDGRRSSGIVLKKDGQPDRFYESGLLDGRFDFTVLPYIS